MQIKNQNEISLHTHYDGVMDWIVFPKLYGETLTLPCDCLWDMTSKEIKVKWSCKNGALMQ